MNGIFRAIGALIFNRPGKDNPAPDQEATSQTAEPKCSILVIDDDPGMLDVLRPLLRGAGFTVLAAQSGARGLDLLRYAQRDIRVVVLDYNMPRLSGSDTLQFVRKLAPHTKVMALSGVAPELLPEEYRTSVDRLMGKPFRNAELLRAVNDLAGFPLPQVAA